MQLTPLTPFLLVFGLLIGFLVNYVADVMPLRRRFVRPLCLQCEAEQPLVNYFLWPRRCTSCGKRRSGRTWAVELVAVLATFFLWNHAPDKLGFWAAEVLLVYFLVVAVIDLEHRLILHPISLAGAVLALALGIWMNGLVSTLLGGVAGFGIMFAFYFLGILFTNLISKRRGGVDAGDALGFGDVNLSGVIGLLLGWPVIMSGLFVGILLGAVFSFIYILGMLLARRYRVLSAVPYGPFLIAGAILLLYT